MDLQGTGWYGVDWINLAWDRDQWRTLVNMAMNIGISISQEELSDMQSVRQTEGLNYYYGCYRMT
jgi:hypothetical protein